MKAYSSFWSCRLVSQMRRPLSKLSDECSPAKVPPPFRVSLLWVEHLQHIHLVLQTLAAHQLFLKRSKCSFAASSMDIDKNYGTIAAPLAKLLCNEGFRWTSETQAAFDALRTAITRAPILQLPDFQLPFIVEYDASGTGFGAVLHQGSRPVAFFSRPVAPRHAKLAAYERELIGLVQAVRHWRPYLWGPPFIVKTDHCSLKFLLDQRLAIIPQHQWASKLIGFDFSVEFKPDHANMLSHRDADGSADSLCSALSGPRFTLFDELRTELEQADDLGAICAQVLAGRDGWSLVNGLWVNRKVFVPASSPLVAAITADAHHTGHKGIQKTLHRVCATFYIPGVRDYVLSCRVCQQNKVASLRTGGLLQPLEVPSAVWADIAIDFIERLPRVNERQFSKFAHFLPLSHPYTSTTVARAFFAEIDRLCACTACRHPSSVITTLSSQVHTGASFSTCKGTAENVVGISSLDRQSIKGYQQDHSHVLALLNRPRQWVQWLTWVKYCYNSSYQASLGTSPFKVVYGPDPPSLRSYDGSLAKLPAVDRQLRDRDEFRAKICDRLRSKFRKLNMIVWVWLRLFHRQAASLDICGHGKLRPRFFGPFKVLAHVGDMVYQLQLPPSAKLYDVFHVGLLKPPSAKLYDVFHVGLLKPYTSLEPMAPSSLPPIRHGRVCPVPQQVLRGRLARSIPELLVHWQGQPVADASCVPLKVELVVQAERDVMYGRQYHRRHR
ncbi:LOW QUALITY PROTEIN: hypothetical protein U9M48_031764 [Paspalum notatum var. saurae]|uniref:Integrase zinc-binding domain-containing protein n=1 Tax=Paspalum notatum var. saurae TaxID=547442 RepID=A0AAQ3U5X3_PASNO